MCNHKRIVPKCLYMLRFGCGFGRLLPVYIKFTYIYHDMSKFEVKCDRCGRDMEFALTPSNEVLLHPCTCICESCPVADRYERYAYTKWMINIKDWIEMLESIEELAARAGKV